MNSILRDWYMDFARNDWFLKYDEDSKILPYNILSKKDEKGDIKYFIEIACAGYKREDLEVNITPNYGVNFLVIKTTNSYNENILNSGDISSYYKHRGIKRSGFTLSFELGKYTEVADVKYEDGILNIELIINKPESDEIKRLKIN